LPNTGGGHTEHFRGRKYLTSTRESSPHHKVHIDWRQQPLLFLFSK
jgi:hypothetical protein